MRKIREALRLHYDAGSLECAFKKKIPTLHPTLWTSLTDSSYALLWCNRLLVP